MNKKILLKTLLTGTSTVALIGGGIASSTLTSCSKNPNNNESLSIEWTNKNENILAGDENVILTGTYSLQDNVNDKKEWSIISDDEGLFTIVEVKNNTWTISFNPDTTPRNYSFRLMVDGVYSNEIQVDNVVIANVVEDNLNDFNFINFEFKTISEDSSVIHPFAKNIYYPFSNEEFMIPLKIDSKVVNSDNFTLSFLGTSGTEHLVNNYTIDQHGNILFSNDTITFTNAIDMFDSYTLCVNGNSTGYIFNFSEQAFPTEVKKHLDYINYLLMSLPVEVASITTYIPEWMSQGNLLNEYQIGATENISDGNTDIKAEIQQSFELFEKIVRDVEEMFFSASNNINEMLQDRNAEYEQWYRDMKEASSPITILSETIAPNRQIYDILFFGGYLPHDKVETNGIAPKLNALAAKEGLVIVPLWGKIIDTFGLLPKYNELGAFPNKIIDMVTAYGNAEHKNEFVDMIKDSNGSSLQITNREDWIGKICDENYNVYPGAKIIVQSSKNKQRYEYVANDLYVKNNYFLNIGSSSNIWTGPDVVFDMSDVYFMYLHTGIGPTSHYNEKYICLGNTLGNKNVAEGLVLNPPTPEPI